MAAFLLIILIVGLLGGGGLAIQFDHWLIVRHQRSRLGLPVPGRLDTLSEKQCRKYHQFHASKTCVFSGSATATVFLPEPRTGVPSAPVGAPQSWSIKCADEEAGDSWLCWRGTARRRAAPV